jgi:hypothetical protein
VVIVVVGPALAVDPTVAQRHIEGLGGRDRRPARALLGDLQPDADRGLVVVGQPRLPPSGVGEGQDVGGIERCHVISRRAVALGPDAPAGYRRPSISR